MQQSPYAQAGSLESQDHRTMRNQQSFGQLRSGSGGQSGNPSGRGYDYYLPGGGAGAGSGGQPPPPPPQGMNRRPNDWPPPPPPGRPQQQQQAPGQQPGAQQGHYAVQVPGQFVPSPTSPSFSVPGSPMNTTSAYSGQTYTPARSPQMSPSAVHGGASHSAGASQGYGPPPPPPPPAPQAGGQGQQPASSSDSAYYAHHPHPSIPAHMGGGHPAGAQGSPPQPGPQQRNAAYSPSQYSVGSTGGGLLPQHHLAQQAPSVPYSPQQPPTSPGTYATYSPSIASAAMSGPGSSASPYFASSAPRGGPPPSHHLSHNPADSLSSSAITATTEHYYGSRSGSVSGTTSHLRERERGFHSVRGTADLRPIVNPQPAERRADPSGGFISPLKALTTHLAQTYHLINPEFKYELSLNPRRVLTKPSKPAGNDGMDNEEADYILYVNDLLGTEEGHKYLILDVLGQGTFGQVVKCQNMKTHEVVAVKVIKNKPAYYQQSMMEVMILELLNNTWDPDNVHHLLRMKDHFIHHKHLCIAFELLSSNLYELIKQNSFRGLSTSLVRVFTSQLLDALTVLNEARLIHCDLKPENILLNTLSSPDIKVIDFGSACHERQTVYTYIQSRFYRSPEVILGLPYSSAIDMWSLGCICVELFLGLPLFPGTSEYNQISRIVEMLGLPPTYMLEVGKQASHFFDTVYDDFGCKSFRLKSLEKYSKEHNVQEQPSKKYFQQDTLDDIISQYPVMRKGMKPADLEKEKQNRIAFIDFVKGLLNLNPIERWSPKQAKQHPFILGEPLRKPFVPPVALKSTTGGKASTSPTVASGQQQPHHAAMDVQQTQPQQQAMSSDAAKRPYGGLLPNQQRQGQKTYDAATYAQMQAQQQVYNAQAHANYQQQQQAAQRSQNPYLMQQDVPPPPPQQQQMQQQPYSAPRLQPSGSGQQLGYGRGAGPSNAGGMGQPHHYGRGRAGTMNEMDVVPPQLQKYQVDLANMAGHSVTPVLRRDPDQYLAWEQRQAGNAGGLNRRVSNRHNPQLEYLHEQAEMGGWGNRMRLPPPTYYGGAAATSMPGPPFSVVVDGSDRRAHGSVGGYDPAAGSMGPPPVPPPPPGGSSARYAGRPGGPGVTGGGGGGTYASPSVVGQPPFDVPPLDAYDHRDGSGAMQFVPMVPKPSPQMAAYYAASQQQGGPPTGGGGGPPPPGQGRSQERRGSGPEWGR